MTDPRYPIGHFEHTGEITDTDIARWTEDIAALPQQLRQVVVGLSDGQLETPYRPGGWTVRQVIHHLSDSHLNSYVRFKLALTEDTPTIKPYDEGRWAELPDYQLLPIQTSVDFLELLHTKWVVLLRSLTPEQFTRRFVHPVSGATSLAYATGLYAWHGRHHLGHISSVLIG
jgi:hypothetical protein